MHIAMFIVFGLVVGAIARMLVPGREPGGWVVSMAIGILGSMIGAFVGQAVGIYRVGETAGFIMSVLGAMVVVAVYQILTRRRSSV